MVISIDEKKFGVLFNYINQCLKYLIYLERFACEGSQKATWWLPNSFLVGLTKGPLSGHQVIFSWG
jgi:hypothetical protein